jgi:hypothetical protein
MCKRTIVLLMVITGFLGKAEAQKGEKSIAAGVLVAVPTNTNLIYEGDLYWNAGVGIEGIGQYNFTRTSAALLQLQFTRFIGEAFYYPETYTRTYNLSISLKAGYRYQFTASGFYANALAGFESDDICTALGVGKRFKVKDIYFLDTGIDFTNGFIKRFNIKAVFSIFKRPKEN